MIKVCRLVKHMPCVQMVLNRSNSSLYVYSNRYFNCPRADSKFKRCTFSTSTLKHKQDFRSESETAWHELREALVSEKPIVSNMTLSLAKLIQIALVHQVSLPSGLTLKEINRAQNLLSESESDEAVSAKLLLEVWSHSNESGKHITLEQLLKAYRTEDLNILELKDTRSILENALQYIPDQIPITSDLYEELSKLTDSPFAQTDNTEIIAAIYSKLLQYNVDRSHIASNSPLLIKIDTQLNLRQHGVRVETNVLEDIIHKDFAKLVTPKSASPNKVRKDQLIKVVSNYKAHLQDSHINNSIEKLHNYICIERILNGKTDYIWSDLHSLCETTSPDLNLLLELLLDLSEYAKRHSSVLSKTNEVQACLFKLYELLKPMAHNFALNTVQEVLNLFTLSRIVDRELLDILTANIEKQFSKLDYAKFSKILYMYADFPISMTLNPPRGHLYHLLKIGFKKCSTSEFISLMLRLVKLELPTMKHDWSSFEILDTELRGFVFEKLNKLDFQQLKDDDKIKLLFLYKLLSQTALSDFLNEDIIRRKLKPLLSSFISLHQEKPSRFQREIQHILDTLKVKYEKEQLIEDIISVDFIVEDNFCLEVNGPHHYYLVKQNNEEDKTEIYQMESRNTWIKSHMLELLGYYSRSVKYYEWEILTDDVDKRQYIRKILRE